MLCVNNISPCLICKSYFKKSHSIKGNGEGRGRDEILLKENQEDVRTGRGGSAKEITWETTGP